MKKKIAQKDLLLIAEDLIEENKGAGLQQDLVMLCTTCGNDVNLTGFVVHTGSVLFHEVWSIIGKEAFTQVVAIAFGSILEKVMPKKGIIDTSMAQLANDFGMMCSKCKTVPFWKEISAFNQAIDIKQKNILKEIKNT
ncbi:hypothetical protein FJ364_02970 [Candidatus Dependentiae bacterium]|nr:hypothetical protein [Candidatus Dependentiae bacterium]